MTFTTIQNSFVSGEVSPSLFGRTDLQKWRSGATTMRNFFVNYRGGASSRAGFAYVGTCLQNGSGPPPRDIPFQFSINQGYALEFGDHVISSPVAGAANNGSGLVRLAIKSTRGMLTGDTMIVTGIVGTTEANGTWTITVIDSTHVDLQSSAFVNAYVSGGTTSTLSGYMRIKSQGAYVVEAGTTISAATNANPLVITDNAHGYSDGDWVYITGMKGMTSLNGLVWIIANSTTNTYQLTDLYGNVVNSLTFGVYTTGGTAQRIYTVASPYYAIDLPYLKYTQSADTMSLTLVNTETNTEYPTYDLERNGATNWVFTRVTFASSTTAPTGISVTANSSTTPNTYYAYVVTAVDAITGEESVASAVGQVQNNDIAINAGSNVISWSAVAGASSYNVYKATPNYSAMVPSGVLFGYMTSVTGTSAVDNNITADFTAVPPVNNNPFTGAGNNPGAVAYYQQRRVYASTLNNPDTYYMSQPGAFLNMDSSVPTTDADAIVGAPWAQQVNGIQFMVPMPGGLVVLTGRGAWQVNGGNSAAITPADQTANPQAYNGCSAIVPPLVVNYDILYVQSKGSIVRDLSYNFFVNIYTGEDKTILSNQLFQNHSIQQWCYAEEPYKIIWAVREDGVMLSLTYLKEQDIYGWARHDTNGLFVGVCSITEPHSSDKFVDVFNPTNLGPLTDAVYCIVKRYINGGWRYYAERMDDRNWFNVEDCFCVDSGLSYPMNFPNTVLTPAAANGTNNITSTLIIEGGAGLTAPVITAVDPFGKGSGASFTGILTGGVLTGITVNTSGQNYSQGTKIQIFDPTATSLPIVQPIITNNIAFNTDANTFTISNVGDVIRAGGGKATVTSYVSPTQVIANVTQPITETIPNDPNNRPIPAEAGTWTITTPTTTVNGLNHLEGMTAAILADGSVVPNQTVQNGAITLPQAASSITIGLPFLPQLQSMYLDPPGQQMTTQSKRKNIYSVAVRMEATRGVSVGSNQPDQSTQPDEATIPWTNMKEIKQRNALITAGSAIPLFTGDEFINIPASWDTKGQIAIQQNYPLPANILAMIAYYQVGDTGG